MKLFILLLLSSFFPLIISCSKNPDGAAEEIREAGYDMSAEGWFTAIASDHIEVMKKMVAAGFDPKTKDQNQRSGLHKAAETGSQKAAGYLLNLGFAIDELAENKLSPLMIAVISDQSAMVKWLLNQGADPSLKNSDGYMPLMLAVSNGRNKAVEELAPYHREELDSALLLAAMTGKTQVIDALTNYGASVYAQMEDGRTPLMLAAQNGHYEATRLLIDIGASRFASTEDGDTAQSFAHNAGHPEIADLIENGTRTQASPQSLSLESDSEVAAAMEEFVDARLENAASTDAAPLDLPLPEADPKNPALAQNTTGPVSLFPDSPQREIAAPSKTGTKTVRQKVSASSGRASAESLQGAQLQASTSASKRQGTPSRAIESTSKNSTQATTSSTARTSSPPIVMRSFRQRELPIEVLDVSGDTASLRLHGSAEPAIRLSAGEKVPGSTLTVIKVSKRMESGKLNDGQPMEVSVVEVEEDSTGQRAEWISGRPAVGNNPVALVEDGVSGQRYLAKPGQSFSSTEGRTFKVTDIRPNQIIVEETETGEVWTLPLRGPRG